jgi:prepilin-type N-terminal cleavage/methylation domain-containing protein
MKRLFVLSGKKGGFTLAEVIVAMAIISFAVLATWRVVTSSLYSITRQDQKVKALYISQAHLARLEADTFSRAVPENWVIGAGGVYWYQMSIYDSPYPSFAANQFIESDFTYWYSTTPDGLGFSNDERDDGILVASADGSSVYTCTSATTNETSGPGTVGVSDYNWDTDDFKLFFDSEDGGEEIQIYYRYYHLVDEGGTVPSSDGEAREKGVIRLLTDPGELNNIAVEEIESENNITPSEYSSTTRKLLFNAFGQGKSVWIYYLPESDTDLWGPDGSLDGYLDPTENSIVGVATGNFCNPDGSATNQIAKTKKITLTEYWWQGGQIQKAQQKAYILDR